MKIGDGSFPRRPMQQKVLVTQHMPCNARAAAVALHCIICCPLCPFLPLVIASRDHFLSAAPLLNIVPSGPWRSRVRLSNAFQKQGCIRAHAGRVRSSWSSKVSQSFRSMATKICDLLPSLSISQATEGRNTPLFAQLI